jgi:type IV secretion system protein TrbJ
MRSTFVMFCIVVFSNWSYASGSAGTAASEGTQLMNNVQLAASNVKQANMVAMQIQGNITMVNQYLAMLTNLKNLPATMLQQARQPYFGQLNALNTLLGSVKRVGNASADVERAMTARISEAGKMGMDVATYMGYEQKMASTKGGYYKERLDQDISTISNAQDRAAQLRAVSEQTQAITGNVEGLQLLNQQSTMMAGELVEIKTALLTQSAERNSDSISKQNSNAAHASTLQSTGAAGSALNTRNGSSSVKSPVPWGDGVSP